MNDTTLGILRRLRETDGYLSGEDLSREFAVSRAAVSKHIRALRNLGCEIESVPRRGHRLLAPADILSVSEIRAHLDPRADRGPIEVFPELDSTNRQAAERARAGAPDGTVIVADRQTAGRGRMQRTWASPAGCNLYVSVVLRPPVPAMRVPELAIVTALALRRAIASFPEAPETRIKWPNDLWIGERKVSGILCEMAAEPDRVSYVIIGVGINVNAGPADLPPELRDSAVSLCTATGRRWSRARLLARFLGELAGDTDRWEAAADLTPFLAEWSAHSLLEGRRIRVESARGEQTGVVRGISPAGHLRLETSPGTVVPIYSGDAHLCL